jgi:hypothetical protein
MPAGDAGMGVDEEEWRGLQSANAFEVICSRTLGGIKDRRSFRWYSDTSMLICSMRQHTSAYVSIREHRSSFRWYSDTSMLICREACMSVPI